MGVESMSAGTNPSLVPQSTSSSATRSARLSARLSSFRTPVFETDVEQAVGTALVAGPLGGLPLLALFEAPQRPGIIAQHADSCHHISAQPQGDHSRRIDDLCGLVTHGGVRACGRGGRSRANEVACVSLAPSTHCHNPLLPHPPAHPARMPARQWRGGAPRRPPPLPPPSTCPTAAACPQRPPPDGLRGAALLLGGCGPALGSRWPVHKVCFADPCFLLGCACWQGCKDTCGDVWMNVGWHRAAQEVGRPPQSRHRICSIDPASLDPPLAARTASLQPTPVIREPLPRQLLASCSRHPQST